MNPHKTLTNIIERIESKMISIDKNRIEIESQNIKVLLVQYTRVPNSVPGICKCECVCVSLSLLVRQCVDRLVEQAWTKAQGYNTHTHTYTHTLAPFVFHTMMF